MVPTEIKETTQTQAQAQSAKLALFQKFRRALYFLGNLAYLLGSMPKKSADDKFEEDIYRFIIKPVIILVGMIIVGAIIDAQLHTDYAFKLIFGIFGGIPAIAYYFKKEFEK